MSLLENSLVAPTGPVSTELMRPLLYCHPFATLPCCSGLAFSGFCVGRALCISRRLEEVGMVSVWQHFFSQFSAVVYFYKLSVEGLQWLVTFVLQHFI